MRFLLFIMMILSSIFCYSQNKCPVIGDTKGSTTAAQHHRYVDSFKNRSINPTKYVNISFDIMSSLTVKNPMKWDSSVYIDGYVLDVQDGGSESCNCHSEQYKDTHIYIVKNNIGDVSNMKKKDLAVIKKQQQSNAIIVEATPRFRSTLGTTNDLEKYIGKHVRIYGYLFRDDEHWPNSTIDGCSGNLWRHTVWEIHPITKIELLQ